jgi:hypothetical protein
MQRHIQQFTSSSEIVIAASTGKLHHLHYISTAPPLYCIGLRMTGMSMYDVYDLPLS